MAYKPKIVASGGGGIYGDAVIQMSPDKKKVKVTIKSRDENKEDKSYILMASDCPATVQSGEFSVALSGDGKKMYYLYPLNGMFSGKFVKISCREGEEPTPNTDQTYGYLYWTPIVKITSPKKFAGMEVRFKKMRYHFDATEEEINGKKYQVVCINHQKSKYTSILSDMLDATGVWNSGPIKYSANILPVLQKRMLKEDKEFKFVMKDGWVSTIFEMEQTEKEEVEEKAEPSDFIPDVEEDDLPF